MLAKLERQFDETTEDFEYLQFSGYDTHWYLYSSSISLKTLRGQGWGSGSDDKPRLSLAKVRICIGSTVAIFISYLCIRVFHASKFLNFPFAPPLLQSILATAMPTLEYLKRKDLFQRMGFVAEAGIDAHYGATFQPVCQKWVPRIQRLLHMMRSSHTRRPRQESVPSGRSNGIHSICNASIGPYPDLRERQAFCEGTGRGRVLCEIPRIAC